MVEKKTRTWKK